MNVHREVDLITVVEGSLDVVVFMILNSLVSSPLS